MLDWGESGAALSHFPQGRAAFFGQFSPRSSIFTPLPLWAPLVARWSPCRPPALASARPLGCSRTEPQREQLVMSKSCQEKRQIPPRGFGCSSPRCCWLADGGGQQLGWWLGCSLLPCQSLGLFLRWLPWGRRCLFERTRGSLINLPGDRCLSPSCSAGDSPKEEPGDAAFSCLPGQGFQPSCIPPKPGTGLLGVSGASLCPH